VKRYAILRRCLVMLHGVAIVHYIDSAVKRC
jgi:hypothetical protein